MYCGDETGAFIGDVGSQCSRFGYGGEDNPKHVVPSYVSKRTVVKSCYHDRHNVVSTPYRMADIKETDPSSYLQQGDVMEDWDAFEALWQDAFDVLKTRHSLKHTTGGGANSTVTSDSGIASSTVRANKSTGDTKCVHPLLSVTHGNTHVVSTPDSTTTASLQYQESVRRQYLSEMTSILLEKLEAPAVFLAPTPMLSSFCHGRQTSLVVDVGAGGSRVTPVVDGLLLRNAQRRSGRGGDWLSSVQLKALQNKVKPRYMMMMNNKKSASNVFHQWAMLDCMYELKTCEHISVAPWRYEHVEPLFVSETSNDDSSDVEMMQTSQDDSSNYTLPDGTTIDFNSSVGKDLARIPELYFADQLPFADASQQESTTTWLSQSNTFLDVPIHKLIHASLTAVGDAHARKELCGNIVLCGAASAGLEQRLSFELKHMIPTTHKCRVISSRNSSERNFAAWIGGSVLTSLGSFQQLWLSKTEYEEYGATLAIQRFPK